MSHERVKLVYLFWHWKLPEVDAARYETALCAFHDALAARRPDGFVRSISSAFSGAPWAANGGDAYVDRYLIRDAAALDALDASVAGVARHLSHENVASMTATGAGGVSALRFGAPLTAPRYAYWFSKPPGVAYAKLLPAAEAMVAKHHAALWMRRMAIGPSPEFCLESEAPVDYPALLREPPLLLRTVWPLA